MSKGAIGLQGLVKHFATIIQGKWSAWSRQPKMTSQRRRWEREAKRVFKHIAVKIWIDELGLSLAVVLKASSIEWNDSVVDRASRTWKNSQKKKLKKRKFIVPLHRFSSWSVFFWGGWHQNWWWAWRKNIWCSLSRYIYKVYYMCRVL